MTNIFASGKTYLDLNRLGFKLWPEAKSCKLNRAKESFNLVMAIGAKIIDRSQISIINPKLRSH